MRFPFCSATRKVAECPQYRHVVPGHPPLCDFSIFDAAHCPEIKLRPATRRWKWTHWSPLRALICGPCSDEIPLGDQKLDGVGRPNPPEVPLTPAVSVRQSVRQDYVVCLDCGYRKTLRRHISSRHGLSADEYLKRWGLRQDHPLTAPAYSERRSALAKQLGLGRNSGTEAAPEPATGKSPAAIPDGEVETTPRPRRTSRSRSRPDVESEAA